MKGSFETNSVEETWNLAREFAKELRPGTVVCLEGDLGAGKTTFTQGLASAMGVRGRVTSPTFCIVQEHEGDGGGLLVHMDLYRLHGEDDVLAIGWEDYLARGAVLVVEWPERAGSLIPPDARHVEMRHVSEESRIVHIDTRPDSVV
ncbi:MAG: tRNA (adenosine(37)-N6)-threonylcarbamoyltransferase complex ATPase subunit type 1 TsaE [Kiritimatiellae bacterium]|nr:tRNA (adenosine(37)-N6)-threonylcarbamoyltransferase complex ATPase subunit type 1 TsaE [Kiritimatiellia bacterium]